MFSRGAAPRTHRELQTPTGLMVVVAAQAGDRLALERVLEVLQEPLFDHLRAILRDDELARDALQHVLLAVARSVRQLRDPRLLTAWALRIANRAAVKRARKHRNAPATLSYDMVDNLAGPELPDGPFEPELIERLHLLLPTLPPECGSAVRLRYLEQLSLVEVAEALEIPVGTLKSRLHYGLGLLRERLSATDGPESRLRGALGDAL